MNGWKRLLVVVLSFVTMIGIVMMYSNVDGFDWTDAVGSGIFVASFYGPFHLVITALLVTLFDRFYKWGRSRAVLLSLSAVVVVTGVVSTTLFVMDGLDELLMIPTIGLVASGFVVVYGWYLIVRRVLK